MINQGLVRVVVIFFPREPVRYTPDSVRVGGIRRWYASKDSVLKEGWPWKPLGGNPKEDKIGFLVNEEQLAHQQKYKILQVSGQPINQGCTV